MFRIKIATCKTKYNAFKLFESVGIDPTIFGNKGLKLLCDRYKSPYRNKGAAAFTSEQRDRKKIEDKKTYNKGKSQSHERDEKTKSIHKRPIDITSRSSYGHWELEYLKKID
ncbi:hypothetical protein R2F61_04905 [Mollicutes bacterium LVI A0078]|nr:hypothetical protein RZE84_04925 [Mollicutes bacterium LVI A0075]WOO90067.1 hypothetical protein R2F61_04905 [Mollicutes bacterium LVI A0078]